MNKSKLKAVDTLRQHNEIVIPGIDWQYFFVKQ